MPMLTADEIRQMQKDRITKANLRKRQKRLVKKLQLHGAVHRHEKFQIELRRVASLCAKMGIHLHHRLEREIFDRVHDS